LLLALTLVSTTALGSRLASNYRANLPPFDLEHDLAVFVDAVRTPSMLKDGLAYSLTLLAILLAHEFGHWFACAWYGVEASLPYFLPAPTFIGTFGAFIRFRSAVANRRQLFDIGVAGPLAGFVFLIPALTLGLALSHVVPGIASMGNMEFGTPLLMRLLEAFLFPGVSPADISLHPVAHAAWVGLLATALNLLPVGQLDGGHLVYAAFGDRHRWVALASVGVMLLLGFLYWPWWVWGALLFFLGRRHFAVVEDRPLGRGRTWLLWTSALIFLLSFIPVPVQIK
jgi:membrane-associated protease RseP (regulator of RpoE activity)